MRERTVLSSVISVAAILHSNRNPVFSYRISSMGDFFRTSS